MNNTQNNPASQQPPHEPIASERIQAPEEGKTFFLDLMENQRGRFLRLKERGKSKSNIVIIPISALKEMADTMGLLSAWSEKNL